MPLRVLVFAASQLSGKGSLKRSAGERANARKTLRDELEAIGRIARGVGLSQFWMPRGRGDLATLNVGYAFARHAEPLKELFIRNHMPEDSVEFVVTSAGAKG
jgi:hypothetical protein